MLHAGDAPFSEESRKRLAAGLRQRFTRIKKRIRRFAEEEGLLDEEG
jgi:hypothetical protein